MTVVEILSGLSEGAYRIGEVLTSKEGVEFRITAQKHLVASCGGENRDMGVLLVEPRPALDNPVLN